MEFTSAVAAEDSRALSTETRAPTRIPPSGESSRKRGKRAALTTLPPTAENTRHQYYSPDRPITNTGPFDYLLDWDRDGSGDNDILDWDQEDWDHDEEAEEGEDANGDADADESRDTLEEGIEGGNYLAPVRDLDAEEETLETMCQQSLPRPGKVPRDEVAKIINESIEAFTNKYYPGKVQAEISGKKKQKSNDPFQLWEEAEALGRRQKLIQQYKFDVEYFEQSLDRVGEVIWKFPNNSIKDVRKKCNNLEAHVENLQEAQWYLSIYESDRKEESEADDSSDTRSDFRSWVSHHPQHVEVIDVGSSPEPSDHEDGDKITSDGNVSAGVLDHQDKSVIFEGGAPAVATNADTFRSSPTIRGPGFCTGSMIHASIDLDEGPSLIAARPAVKPQGNKPEIASVQTVTHWDMKDLVNAQDRKRIIQRMVLQMSADREITRVRIRAVRKENILKEIRAYINMLCENRTRIQGVLPQDLRKIEAITNFFLCWWFAEDCFTNPPSADWLQVLAANLDDCDDLDTFYHWMWHILHSTFSEDALKNPEAPSKGEIVVISDSEGEDMRPAPSSSRNSQVRGDKGVRNDVMVID
ncbi:hypothetical protein N0V90_001771 [Kalmusia sp. IMI 367209]|nr:hypothetical protein N0V90_001771 [Kalmusia sp. IMI 367209]